MRLLIDESMSRSLLYHFILLKVTKKILLYSNRIILFIFFPDILLYRHPDYIIDIVTVTILELSQ